MRCESAEPSVTMAVRYTPTVLRHFDYSSSLPFSISVSILFRPYDSLLPLPTLLDLSPGLVPMQRTHIGPRPYDSPLASIYKLS